MTTSPDLKNYDDALTLNNIPAILFWTNVHGVLTRQMGNLLHRDAEIDFSQTRQILDVACGPGIWALDFAYTYPQIQVDGIDLDPAMIAHARCYAKAQQQENIHFFTGNMQQMNDIPNDTYDLVHIRFITEQVHPDRWLSLLSEFVRICRPGGFLCWTEVGQLVTNSIACNCWYKQIQQALTLAGRTIDITPIMETLLSSTDCINVQRHISTIDLSKGTTAYNALAQDFQRMSLYIQPFVMRMLGRRAKEPEHLRQRLSLEMLSETFRAIWPLTTVWGQKHNL